MGWAKTEMREVNLGDKRLDARLIHLTDSLSAKASASIPVACQNWAEVKAAYRFFDNRKVTAEKIHKPHLSATLERIRAHPVVLLLQDTTTLNFTGQKQRTDIGPLNHEKHRGLLLHPTLAVTPERLCLGVVDSYHWAREQLHHHTSHREKNRINHTIPIEEKESYRWVEGYRKAAQIAKQTPKTLIVSISDREGDIYDLYHEAQFSTENHTAYWLIRASKNRRLLDDADELRQQKLIETVKSTIPIGIIEFDLPARGTQKQRRIKQALYMSCVKLSPPDRKRKQTRYHIVETNVVIASEVNPPTGEEPIEWVLLTNVPIKNSEDAQTLLQWYLCRWQIEVYFRILKSGCQVEKLQLETKTRFDTCLTLYMIIAWRILYLTLLARACPDLPCNVVFSDEEWEVIYKMTYQKKPP
ncbi:MAG: IS4 family transposase, partial [Gammaproteobacteria bacterium]